MDRLRLKRRRQANTLSGTRIMLTNWLTETRMEV